MPEGTQLAVITPGQNQKYYVPGTLHLATGTLLHCLRPRKTTMLCRELLQTLEEAYPANQYRRMYVVVDDYKIHKAKAVEEWFVKHPRVRLLVLPTY
jgi:putative transposase